MGVTLIISLGFQSSSAAKILIPMNSTQTNHLKAYGVAFWILKSGGEVEWLLNYEGGSFLCAVYKDLEDRLLSRGVTYQEITSAEVSAIYRTIEVENMEKVQLEKAPKMAVYSPPTHQPWDDAVTLALAYAEITYDVVWDEEVLTGRLEEYDWLHLHHEDFTGQYGKFYAAYRNKIWYQQDVKTNLDMARKLGYTKVSKMKADVALTIREYVVRGGFMFAMCSAPETIDIALAARNTDIVPREFDGDPINTDATENLDYSLTFAFENFKPVLDPFIYSHSDIDTYPMRLTNFPNARNDVFYLFDFSAKLDPVPTMLVQNHVQIVNGFMGQATGFNKNYLKKFATILGEVDGFPEARYIHGNLGRGTFTFLGGHDPEDYQHMVGDPKTELKYHKNSPGYRLVLNNILFPAAKKKERKT
ncbi:MAG: asparagine synthetase B [candidate division Zixibacteria bacterium]|nr:asparagine synthetase B [candidate division Zixibacteria bacterium]